MRDMNVNEIANANANANEDENGNVLSHTHKIDLMQSI